MALSLPSTLAPLKTYTMADSLKAQLMKAGLADAKKAKKIEHEKRLAAKGQANEADAKQLAQQAQQEKLERDRELNRQQTEEKARKAQAAQIKQLIEAHRLDRAKGDTPYNFVDDKKVKKLYVTAPLQQQLVNGQIAIVRLEAGYELVPAVVAERIKTRDAAVVVLLNDKPSDQPAEDDPYKDYQIPDDLMW